VEVLGHGARTASAMVFAIARCMRTSATLLKSAASTPPLSMSFLLSVCSRGESGCWVRGYSMRRGQAAQPDPALFFALQAGLAATLNGDIEEKLKSAM